MAEVLPTQPHLGMDITKGRNASGPLPNPHFVFPMQSGVPTEANSHANNLSNADATGSRHSAGRSRPQRISINKLPEFDFSPAVTSPTNRTSSPARSPTRRTPPIHHGHRRNNSEYVGGDVTNGGPVLVSVSPTKSEQPSGHGRSENGMSGDGHTIGGPSALDRTSMEKEESPHPPPGNRLGPPTTRRGHAHRRSGAISSHDLSMILKPTSEMKGGSAPTTPSDSMFHRPLPPELDRSISQPEITTSTQESLALVVKDEQSPHAEPPRPSRVGFSDVLEFIPRPLSTISSETSSSMSTIRATHSVSNSITSMIGGGNSSSPQSTINVRSGRRSTLELDSPRARPNTAGNSSPRASQDWQWEFSGRDSPVRRPSSAPAGSSPSKGANGPPSPSVVETPFKVANDPFATSPTYTEKFCKTTSSPTSRAANLQAHRRRPLSPTMRPRTSPEPKVTKRQRKGRSWADLLSRKGKHHPRAEFVSRPSPTPPLRQHIPETEFSLDNMTFDEDTTCIIETASSDASKLPRLQTNYAAWKPRETSPLSETDSSASMLDIDAALGSFDFPSIGPAFEDVVSGGMSGSKRRMHSSGITGGFAGPGMHYHRRAESAPEMETIDRSKFGFPRLGSNPTMAIEEEEEEDDEEAVTSKPANASTRLDQEELQDDQTPGLGVNVVEAESNIDRPMQRGMRRSSSRRVAEDNYPAIRSSPKLDAPEAFGLLEIVGADEEPRFSVVTKSSDESTITPTLSHDPLEARPVSAPLDFAMPTPALTYNATPETPSSVSSPDFSRTSFDMPRMHTASSSITDRATLNSSRAGDHALTLHSSVDDVPSLTSSASTMASGHPPRVSSSANTCSSADRSGSFSAPTSARTRPVSAGKRNSLASLTRLVGGGSYNRSKLNIEECVQPDTPEKTERKKGNRISRLMKFWKSKEKLSSS